MDEADSSTNFDRSLYDHIDHIFNQFNQYIQGKDAVFNGQLAFVDADHCYNNFNTQLEAISRIIGNSSKIN